MPLTQENYSMKLIADLHVHTIACDHAFSTFMELVAAAQQKGLAMLGISDHGPGCPDGPHRYYFLNGYRFPKQLGGLEIRFGIEDDIIDEDGTLALAVEDRKHLDYMMVGLHGHSPIAHKGEKVRTKSLMNALIKNSDIKIITHPAGTALTTNLDEVLPLCAERGVCVELNGSKLRLRAEIMQFLEKTIKYNNHIVVNSDAHISYEVGKTGDAIELLQSLGYPQERVVNTSLQKLKKHLGI